VKRKLDAKLPHLETIVRGTPTLEGKSKVGYEDYKKWIITSEPSVCGRGSENLQAWLPDREIKPNEWDSYGIELVSRVLNTGDPTHKDEINAILDGVKGAADERYDAFITNQCGLHVHVEAPKDFRVLKELAVLTLVYEEQISTLHPPCRGYDYEATLGTLCSNRLAFIFRENEPEKRHKLREADCSTIQLGEEYTFQALRARIDECSTVEELSQLMCWPKSHTPLTVNGDRNRIINWTYLCRGDEYPQTIEFRQARGTLKPGEVHNWVDFCVGLVRLAEFYAYNPDHFPIVSFRPTRDKQGNRVGNVINVFRLMDKMGLSEEAKEFWRWKVVRYLNYSLEGVDDRTDNELPPEYDETETDDEEHPAHTDDEGYTADKSRSSAGSFSDVNGNTGAKDEIIEETKVGTEPQPTTNAMSTDTGYQSDDETSTIIITTGPTQTSSKVSRPTPASKHSSTEPEYSEEDSLGPAGRSLTPNTLHSKSSNSNLSESPPNSENDLGQSYIPPTDEQIIPDVDQDVLPTLAEIQAAAQGNADHDSKERSSSDEMASMLKYLELVSKAESVGKQEAGKKRKSGGGENEGGEGGEEKKSKK